MMMPGKKTNWQHSLHWLINIYGRYFRQRLRIFFRLMTVVCTNSYTIAKNYSNLFIMSIVTKFSIEGKTALVTGCKRGIGKAVTIALAEAGANIIGVSATLEL